MKTLLGYVDPLLVYFLVKRILSSENVNPDPANNDLFALCR